MKFLLALGALVVGTLGLGSAADANVINFGVVAVGDVGYTAPASPNNHLNNSTAFNFDSALLLVSNVGPADMSGLAVGDSVALSPALVTYGSGSGSGLDTPLATDVTKSWTAGGDTFTESLTTVDAIDRTTSNAITVTLSGTLSDSLGDFVDAPAFFILSANQVGGPGSAIVAGFTNTSFIGGIPEPSTWAMMALGFLGLAYTAFRRNAKGRAVAI